MFVPDLFGIVKENLIETFPEVQEHDSEDLTDDRYLLEVFIFFLSHYLRFLTRLTDIPGDVVKIKLRNKNKEKKKTHRELSHTFWFSEYPFWSFFR